jgi:hypothetical protein
MKILNWTLRMLSGILLLIPMVLAIPGYMLYVLAEEIEDYQDKQVELEKEMQQLKKENDGEEIIL